MNEIFNLGPCSLQAEFSRQWMRAVLVLTDLLTLWVCLHSRLSAFNEECLNFTNPFLFMKNSSSE